MRIYSSLITIVSIFYFLSSPVSFGQKITVPIPVSIPEIPFDSASPSEMERIESTLKESLLNTPCGKSTSVINDEGEQVHIFHFDNAIAQNLDHLFTNADPQCVQEFLTYYILWKEERIDSYCENSSNCPEELIGNEIYLQNSQRLLATSYNINEEQARCHLDTVNNPNDLNEIKNLLRSLEQAFLCQEPSQGQSRVISSRITTVPAGYTMENLGGNNLLATVAIDFTAGPAATIGPADLMQKTKQCLNSLNDYFRSPSGEMLQIKIISPTERLELPAYQRPPINSVTIDAPDLRANSRAYPSDIQCSTIAHEVMHLLGLVDEYEEQILGYYINTSTGEVVSHATDKLESDTPLERRNRFQCRAIAETASIMKNHRSLFDSVIPRKDICYCPNNSCPSEGDLEISTKIIPGSLPCPPDSRHETEYLPFGTRGSSDISFTPDSISAARYPENPRASLLTPAQFERIKFGGCESAATKYTGCAVYAYLDDPELDCPDRPQYCEDQEQWLHTSD